MKEKKFQLFISKNGNQITLDASTAPSFWGNADSCSFKMSDEFEGVKAFIQVLDNKLHFKSLDPSLVIFCNGQSSQDVALETPAFIQFAGYDVVVNVQEVSVESAAAPVAELPKAVPSIPTKEPSIEKVSVPTFLEEKKSAKVEVEPSEVATPSPVVAAPVTVELDSNIDNFFSFNTVFDEQKLDLNKSPQSVHFDYSRYIDPIDETIAHLPEEDIAIATGEKCIKITHKNNGIILNTQFFPLDSKKVFMSSDYENSDTIQIHDCNLKKAILVNNESNKISVNKIDNYSFYESTETYRELTDEQYALEEDQKLTLVRGTSLIDIEVADMPSEMKKVKFFGTNEQLLKHVATSWGLAIASLLILFLVIDTPIKEDKPKRELVVIYKRKKVKKASASAASKAKSEAVEKQASTPPAAAPTQMKPEMAKADKPTVKKVQKVKTVAKSEPKKKPAKKPVKVKASKRVKKFSKVAKKSAPKAVKKKSYSFSSSSKMLSALGTSKASFKSAKKSRFNASNSLGKSGRISNNLDARKTGKIGTGVSRFATGSASGSSTFLGTRGLSGKTKAATAYLETTTKVLGAMDPELIRKIMREYIPQFRYCYQRELLTNSKVAGVFDVQFKINSVGKGVKVGVKSVGTSFSRKGINCLKRVVSLIKFPRPKGGGSVDVKQPMNFSI